MINIKLVEDHKMFAEIFTDMINKSDIARVSATYYDLATCREGLTYELPDILLLDLSLPDGSGIDFCAEITKQYPNLKVLIITTFNDHSIVRLTIDAGARGYIVKSALFEEFITAIRSVYNNEIYFCNEIKNLLSKKKDDESRFTLREKQIIKLLGEGFIISEIADKMSITPETVKRCYQYLLKKLNVHNYPSLIIGAKKRNLI